MPRYCALPLRSKAAPRCALLASPCSGCLPRRLERAHCSTTHHRHGWPMCWATRAQACPLASPHTSPAGSASRWLATSSLSTLPAPLRWCVSTGLVDVLAAGPVASVPRAAVDITRYRSKPVERKSVPGPATVADNALQPDAYSALPARSPSSDRCPAVLTPTPAAAATASPAPPSIDRAHPRAVFPTRRLR